MVYGQAVNQVGQTNVKKYNSQKITMILLLEKIFINTGIVNIIPIGHF